MRRIVMGPLLLTFGLAALYCQEDKEYGWSFNAVGSFLANSDYYHKWAKGGQDAYSWQLKADGGAVLDRPEFSLSNSGHVEYGRIQIGDQPDRKSSDELRLESVYTYKVSRFLNPYGSLLALTQFTEGFAQEDTNETNPIAGFMDPLYLTGAIGLGYRPVQSLETRLGAAVKATFTDEHNRYSDDPATAEIETYKFEPGVESVTEFKRQFLEQFFLKSSLNIFSNLKGVDEVDIRWLNTVAVKIVKYISIDFTAELLKDQDMGTDEWQYRHGLAFGLTYTFL